MQQWEAMQHSANYEPQHNNSNNWYGGLFAAQIKTEPGTSPSPPNAATSAQLEHYLNLKQQQQHQLDAAINNLTPSPSNHDSMQHFYDSNMHQQLMQQQQQHKAYQQHFQAAAQHTNAVAQMPLGFNPLTPPGLPNAVLPPMPHFYAHSHSGQRQQQQTPSPTPGSTTLPLTQSTLEAVDKLQSALTPRSTPPMDVTPPKSPKSQCLLPMEQDKDDQDLQSNSSEELKYMPGIGGGGGGIGAGDSEDDESIRMPIYNSHGKMKNYKCKSCGLVAFTKIAFWEHARSHMKPEKILQCPKCPFVTELKHHLEYHIRKHKNLKPFQCDKCSYSCVNKSMLNSHRKSHSSVYQYRCADCDYATKYCHSFKLHLRKYDHTPGLVLDEEGVPNPAVVIDVYGTRRGPKSKSGAAVSGSLKRSHSSSVGASSTADSGSMQLSAALQGFAVPPHQLPASPAKSTSSTNSEHPPPPQAQSQPMQPQLSQQATLPQMPNLLSPLAKIMRQNHNMAFFPYWNLNLQMLAAQQQAAVMAQLSPELSAQLKVEQGSEHLDKENDDEDGDDDEERKSIDSAMDLTQITPVKDLEQAETDTEAINLKLPEDANNETPVGASSSSSARRKGRVLKLETVRSGATSDEAHCSDEAASSADDSMEKANAAAPVASSTPPATKANTSASSTASSSGNSSNSSSSSSSRSNPVSAINNNTNTNNNNNNGISIANAAGAIYECKYCDIYFKDAVLYTIHMGYHSCDDVFKCNMCGEKCDGPVGLFVHMARNAHS